MKALKKEVESVAALLAAGGASPEELATAVIAEVDRLRGERLMWFGAFITYGVPGAVGPFSTKKAAERALSKLATDKAWTVLGRTEEGVEQLMVELDAPPEPVKLSAKAQREQDSQFWRKVHAIRNGEADGIVLERIKVIQVPR